MYLAVLVIVAAFVGFKIIHSCIAFLTEITWQVISGCLWHGVQSSDVQKKALRTSRADSVVA